MPLPTSHLQGSRQTSPYHQLRVQLPLWTSVKRHSFLMPSPRSGVKPSSSRTGNEKGRMWSVPTVGVPGKYCGQELVQELFPSPLVLLMVGYPPQGWAPCHNQLPRECCATGSTTMFSGPIYVPTLEGGFTITWLSPLKGSVNSVEMQLCLISLKSHQG